jgi:hypothetical protein
MASRHYKGGLTRARPYKEVGQYIVPHGRHEIEFAFDYPIMNVFIACPSLEQPVCSGDLNWFSVTLLPFGFIMHADVKTDSATVTWVTVQGRDELAL